MHRSTLMLFNKQSNSTATADRFNDSTITQFNNI